MPCKKCCTTNAVEKMLYIKLCSLQILLCRKCCTENAVQKFREVIGDTDPNQAEEGTVRQLYGESKERNTIHGSDSDENARIEIEFFFPGFFGST